MARRRGPRGLDPSEAQLWERIAASTRPLRSAALPGPLRSNAAEVPRPAPPQAPPPQPSDEARPIAPFRIGALLGSTAPPPTDAGARAGPPAPRMDGKAFRKLTRGRIEPEARLDLHGMTQAEAQAELSRFVVRSQAAGRRLVLVITGKGRAATGADGLSRPAGALRRAVPLWLTAPPLAPLVQETAPAHPRHGGGGALYVWLRRRV
jgi:DNA-nicking Smr family endonuclease